MMKGKESHDPGKFRSFGELVNVANESGAIRSFGEYLSRAIPTQPQTIASIPEQHEIEEINEPNAFDGSVADHVETRTESEVKKPRERVIEERVDEESSVYRVIKDRTENFECSISVEGTTLSESKARIILESDAWNFTFYGTIGPDGKCVVPIRKGIPLPEGATGTIKLEVIADDQLFVGWENEFVVETSKKVKVALKESKSVRVSFRDSN
jgi:hypothetical protein